MSMCVVPEQHCQPELCSQDRVRELESEIEWVRAERQDAQQAAQREQKQAQARIKEAEDAASRAKAARRSATVACSQASPSAGVYCKTGWNCLILLLLLLRSVFRLLKYNKLQQAQQDIFGSEYRYVLRAHSLLLNHQVVCTFLTPRQLCGSQGRDQEDQQRQDAAE